MISKLTEQMQINQPKIIYTTQLKLYLDFFNIDFIINIIMLQRIAKPALSILLRSKAQCALKTFRPCFTFSKSIQNTSKLQSILSEEIKHQEQNKQDLSEFTNFYQNYGWTVNYDGVQIQLSKKSGPYNVRILVNARPPMDYSDDQSQLEQGQGQGQGQQNQQPLGNEDFSQISAFIQKDGGAKWLCADFIITNGNEVQLAQAAFINDYAAEKADRKKGRIPNIAYQGPQITTLQQNLQNEIYSFLQSIGLTGQVLQKASQFSVAYEHKFYVQWLKDLKSLV